MSRLADTKKKVEPNVTWWKNQDKFWEHKKRGKLAEARSEILKHENEANHAENQIRGLKGHIESQELDIRRTLEKGMRNPGENKIYFTENR